LFCSTMSTSRSRLPFGCTASRGPVPAEDHQTCLPLAWLSDSSCIASKCYERASEDPSERTTLHGLKSTLLGVTIVYSASINRSYDPLGIWCGKFCTVRQSTAFAACNAVCWLLRYCSVIFVPSARSNASQRSNSFGYACFSLGKCLKHARMLEAYVLRVCASPVCASMALIADAGCDTSW